MTIDKVFEVVSDDFGKGKIPCVVIGGIAVNFYKYNRQTTDVDFMICKEDFEKAKKGLEKLGYRLWHQQDSFAQFESDDRSLADIDLMFVDKNTLDEVLIGSKEFVVAGKSYRVPSLMNLIALKLHSSKGSKFRELKDLLDIVSLVRNNDVDFKSHEFKSLCLKYGNDSLYEKIIEHSPVPEEK